MKLVNRVEIKLENFDKCSFICDSDAPLGSLYDFASALKCFIMEKMKAAEEAQKQAEPEVPVQKEEVKPE